MNDKLPEFIPIASVKLWPLNANKHTDAQVNELAKSYGKWKQYKNIVVWQGYVICGNAFYMAAQKLGVAEILAIDYSHLSEEEAKELSLADNELPRGSTLDYIMVAEIVERARSKGEQIPGVDTERAKEIIAKAKSFIPVDDVIRLDEIKEVQEETEKVTCPGCGLEFDV